MTGGPNGRFYTKTDKVKTVRCAAGSHLRRKATRVHGAIHGGLLSHSKRDDTVFSFGLSDTPVSFRRS